MPQPPEPPEPSNVPEIYHDLQQLFSKDLANPYPGTCKLHVSSIIFLGYVFEGGQVRTDPEKTCGEGLAHPSEKTMTVMLPGLCKFLPSLH